MTLSIIIQSVHCLLSSDPIRNDHGFATLSETKIPTTIQYFPYPKISTAKCLINIFADDTKAYMPIKSKEDQETLQYSINKLVEWTDKWLLKFNSDKCKILHLGKNNPKYKYHIKEGDIISDLTETLGEKDLCIFIDSQLNVNAHITTAVKKKLED